MVTFDYKKYKHNITERYVPINIKDYYKTRNAFIIYSTKTAVGIPILKFGYEGLRDVIFRSNPALVNEFPPAFDHYANGFLAGFESSFTPFISTPETIKETILIAVRCSKTGFPTSYRDLNDFEQNAFFSAEAFYSLGFRYGRNYKAWLLVLETPKFYSDDDLFKVKVSVLQPIKSDAQIVFTDLFTDAGKKIIPQIKTLYIEAKPLEFAYMLRGLFKLKLLHSNPEIANMVMLHKVLKDEFGNIGTRQSLSTNIKKQNFHTTEQIKLAASKIKTLLDS